MADKLDSDKNVTGGTGITAGGNVDVHDVNAPLVIGDHITIIEKTSQKPAEEASKNVVYQAEFQGQSLTRTMPDCTQETSPVNLDEIHQIEDVCKDYRWNKSQKISQQIGERLFNILRI